MLFRAAALAPGAYTVESAVFDQRSGDSSVRIRSLDIPTTLDGAAGDIYLVRGIVPIDGLDGPVDHPFVSGSTLARPFLGDSLSRAVHDQLVAALPVRGMPSGSPLFVQVLNQGVTVFKTTTPVIGHGDVTSLQVFQVPLASVPNGIVDLYVSGELAGRRWTRSLRVTLR